MIKIDLENRKKRAEIANKILKELFPNPEIELSFSNPWQLLVAVVLSAQSTDVTVNKVTEKLFKKYPKLEDYLNADLKEFEQDIYPTGFYRAKTKNILNAARLISEKFGDVVPSTMEKLLIIPGIARKSANIILSAGFGKVEGIAVDTHVKRLSAKFQLTENTDPVKIEKDLMLLIPKDDWMDFSFRLVLYGRRYSPARKNNDFTDPISIAISKDKL